jgi:predicted DNA-binding antitoxin AbrB/MazE fold protein
MKVIRAVFENGIFRPIEPVDLPEGSEVEFEPRPVTIEPTPVNKRSDHQKRIYELLSQTIETGETDMAERHDEPPATRS